MSGGDRVKMLDAYFGAGMTGGMGFIYDPEGDFARKVNPESVVWQRIGTEHWNDVCRGLVERHFRMTASRWAESLLSDWERTRAHIWQVVPKEMLGRMAHPLGNEALQAAE